MCAMEIVIPITRNEYHSSVTPDEDNSKYVSVKPSWGQSYVAAFYWVRFTDQPYKAYPVIWREDKRDYLFLWDKASSEDVTSAEGPYGIGIGLISWLLLSWKPVLPFEDPVGLHRIIFFVQGQALMRIGPLHQKLRAEKRLSSMFTSPSKHFAIEGKMEALYGEGPIPVSQSDDPENSTVVFQEFIRNNVTSADLVVGQSSISSQQR